MRVSGAAVAVAVLSILVVLLWPLPRRRGAAAVRDSLWAAPPSGPGGPGNPADETAASLWHQDPVEVFRRWRLRRRSGELVDDVLELLRGVGPALDAGLTPSRSIELAAFAALGADRVARARASAERSRASGARRRRAGSTERSAWPWGRRGGQRSQAGAGVRHGRPERGPDQGPDQGTVHGSDRGFDQSLDHGSWSGAASSGPVAHDIDLLVGALLASAHRAEALSPVWALWAARSGSAELALVAAAWQLSETTGAPLSFAVDRAVRGLLDARARRRKVAVAVAGPRATVTVLTVLPLSGPLFGLAVGIDPRTLYLGSGLATACVAAGLGLVWAGRLWCTRMVRRAVRS